jgi:hypothetical protein
MSQIKLCRKSKHTFCVKLLFFESPSIYEIMSKNTVESKRPQANWHQRVVYWISKSTYTEAHYRSRAPTPTYKHIHTHTHTHTNTDRRTDVRTRMRALTHTPVRIQNYVILIAFHGNSGYVNAPLCYVRHTLSLLSSHFQCDISLRSQLVKFEVFLIGA